MNKNHIYGLEGIFASFIAVCTAKMGVLFYGLGIFAGAMIIDFISGMAASKKESMDNPGDTTIGWSSKKGLKGIIKKFGFIFVVCVAIMLDFMIYKMGGYLGITLPTSTFFGLLITVWFILNEFLSIIEDAGRMGVKGIPKFLTSTIAVLKNKVEEKGEK